MVDNDVACDGSWARYAYKNLCKHSSNWAKQKFCQRSCFANGAGYDGDECCAERPTACTECTDERNQWMATKDLACDRWPYAYTKLCKHSSNWAKQKFCQRSCFANGAGYDGDECCEQTHVSPS